MNCGSVCGCCCCWYRLVFCADLHVFPSLNDGWVKLSSLSSLHCSTQYQANLASLPWVCVSLCYLLPGCPRLYILEVMRSLPLHVLTVQDSKTNKAMKPVLCLFVIDVKLIVWENKVKAKHKYPVLYKVRFKIFLILITF